MLLLEDSLRSYSNPRTVRVPDSGNLTDDVVRQASGQPDRVLLRRPDGENWHAVTAAEFRDLVASVAKGLIAWGISPGDRVGLLCGTRFEWTLLDYAIWWAGAVSVPVYVTAPADQVAWVLTNSGVAICLTETSAQAEMVRSTCPGLDVGSLDNELVQWLTQQGHEVSDDSLESRRGMVGPSDAATFLYTSGTMGRPKGCVLTHGNVMAELDAVTGELADLFEVEDASTLVFLPMAHVFARLVQVACIRSGVVLGHTAEVTSLQPALTSFRPTFVLAVPRAFEKLFTTASQQAAIDGRARTFERACETAIAMSRARDEGSPGAVLRARHAMYERRVYRRLRAALGGRVRYAVSGGAPLGERLAHFFRGIGIPVLEGYGLTETTAALTLNLPAQNKIGTVGRPLPGVEVSLADDGELSFRGPQVFRGYWNDERATREVLDPDGWFRTGDLGELDPEGYVRIVGRKQEIIVTAGGKNVAPSVLEDHIREHPLVSQCFIVGDGKPFIAALITLDSQALEAWAQASGRPVPAAPDRDREVRAAVQQGVERANAQVSQAESVRAFELVNQEWTEESGHLTPSLKLKRSALLRDFHDEVERLYT